MPAEQQQTSVQLNVKWIMDTIGLAIPIGTAAVQFFKDQHSYEVVFLSLFCLALYVAWRQNREVLTRDKAETAELRTLLEMYQLRQEKMNGSLLNMYADLAAYAGTRQIGAFVYDKETRIQIYERAPIRTPPQGPRRAEDIALDKDG